MVDPRRFTVKSCPTTKGVPNDSKERKDFFSQLGKVGDLEFLNNSALGTDVGQGLRGLASLSNSIRIGDKALPSFIGSAVDAGANIVLDAVGIGPAIVETLKPFHPDVVNRAVGQAEAIWDDVTDGTYKLEDIPDTFSDLQNLERLARGIYTPSDDTETGPEICEASPWAMDLDPFFPKYKFLFLVQFELNEPYNLIQQGQQPNIFEFVIKHSTRPNIEFDYEEVNMYNFRTRVARRTVYQPMTMRFYDDNVNRIMQFYTLYLKAMSPIANQPFFQKSEGTDWYEQSGMSFNELTQPAVGIDTRKYSGSLGPLEGDTTKTLIKRITLYHIFSHGRKANKYIFFNPKVTNMDLDELDMATAGEGNEVSLQFAYDGLYISPGMTVKKSGPLTDLQERAGAKWPFHYVSSEEDIKPEPGGAPPGEQTEEGSGGLGGALDNLTSLGTQAVAVGQDAIDFATQAGSNAITGITNTVTSTARGAVNSVAGAAAGLFGGGPKKLG